MHYARLRKHNLEVTLYEDPSTVIATVKDLNTNRTLDPYTDEDYPLMTAVNRLLNHGWMLEDIVTGDLRWQISDQLHGMSTFLKLVTALYFTMESSP